MKMQINNVCDEPAIMGTELQEPLNCALGRGIAVALLTGCQDRHYAFGLATALASRGISVDIIGSDEIDSPELHQSPNLNFLNFRRRQSETASFSSKLEKLVGYYAKLLVYITVSSPGILHVLWNGRLELFDRTVLMLYYKVLRKKVVFTAHNVNQGRRDAKDSWLNRTTLKVQYRLCDHIFVHTQKMKDELCGDFGVAESVVTVIRYPVNNAFPDTDLTAAAAKQRLGLKPQDRAILFFGRLVPYKGIEHLLEAFRLLVANDPKCRLIIAGEPKKGAETYLNEIQSFLGSMLDPDLAILKAEFIADEDLELYFKAADIMVLPYKEIFQSGVLFLAFSFGLPVVATDVGSFREEILEGSTGFLCQPADPASMAAALKLYFASSLYRDLESRRRQIADYARAHHSWEAVAESTYSVYRKISTVNAT
jgi:D-inositol-3-phosphate glycosyltransferase